jgi:hypothetical protein
MAANVRLFERASRNPENPDFSAPNSAAELLHQVAPETKPDATHAEPAASPTAAQLVVKHSRLSVYLTPEEHWLIRDRANARRVSINDYVRSLLLAPEP